MGKLNLLLRASPVNELINQPIFIKINPIVKKNISHALHTQNVIIDTRMINLSASPMLVYPWGSLSSPPEQQRTHTTVKNDKQTIPCGTVCSWYTRHSKFQWGREVAFSRWGVLMLEVLKLPGSSVRPSNEFTETEMVKQGKNSGE